MPTTTRKAILTAAVVVLLSGAAEAQQPGPDAAAAQMPAPELTQTPPVAYRGSLASADVTALQSALDNAKRGNVEAAEAAISSLSDPIARKIAIWALADTSTDAMSFFEIDQARRSLAGWPRAAKRQAAAEKLIETSGQAPQQIIEWFGGTEPTTAEGAMALAAAFQATGHSDAATALVRRFWRDRLFDADAQRSMLARFGGILTTDDHVRRADIVLYGKQGPAAQDMIALLPADQARLAQARIALRQGSGNALGMANNLPASVAASPGLAFERAAFYARRGQEGLAIGLLPNFPTDVPAPEMATRIWDLRHQLTLYALKAGDNAGAYAAASNTGLTQGTDATEAEFYAGWIALTRLQNPSKADTHFEAIEKIGSSPITRARAFYWRGRAAEAQANTAAANGYYAASARYNTTFYGQLAGEKVSNGKIILTHDPRITQADRNRFDARDTVQAARLLNELGNRDLFRSIVLALDDVLPSAEEEALLVDLARNAGDMDTSMKVVRSAAQRGFILPDRGYPVRTPPQVFAGAEPALVLAITRQESGFDPLVRSGPGARGMMQLMPSTASVLARRMGVGYSPGMLDDPDYNMRLGSTYLGQLMGQFSGSFPMAIAGYNAGPGRPTQWSSFCGDPRGAGTDPIDFIECIPFSETRNYVMRVMEGMTVYRAKLNGGAGQITLSQDLKGGGYAYAQTEAGPAGGAPSPGTATMAPIPNP